MSDKKATKKDQKNESLKKDDKKEIKETKESKKELAKAEAKKAETKKAKKESSSSSSDDSSSDDEPMPPAKAKDSKVAPKADSKKKDSSSDSSSDSDSDDKPKKKEESKKEAPKKEEAKKETPKKEEAKKGSKKDSSSSDSSSDSDSDDEKPAAKKAEPKKEEAKKVEKKDDKKESSSDNSSDDSSSEEEKEPKKRKADEIEAKAPPAKKQKTEAGSVATGSTETVDDSITRCFVGNLSFDIDDDAMKAFFKEGGLDVVDIQWFNSREGKFRGCGLIDFGTGAAARKAVEMSEKECLGRAVKINLDKPKEGRFDAGGRGGQERRPPRAPTAKPDGCDTIFIGNLSYDIQDDNVKEFFADCGEVLQIRWPTRPDGSFPGIGFVQFTDTNATDKAVAKAGTALLGRPIRCDFAESKSRNQ